MFQVTDKTVVTFSDRSEGSFKVVDAEILGSTSKLYREGENKENNLRVFLCVEENEDNDDDADFFMYDVQFAMIVRN